MSLLLPECRQTPTEGEAPGVVYLLKGSKRKVVVPLVDYSVSVRPLSEGPRLNRLGNSGVTITLTLLRMEKREEGKGRFQESTFTSGIRRPG